jgi:hypothetical protein
MATDNECAGYARECVRLAALTTDPQLREELLKIAREWMAMARQGPPAFDVLAPNRGPAGNWNWLATFRLKVGSVLHFPRRVRPL